MTAKSFINTTCVLLLLFHLIPRACAQQAPSSSSGPSNLDLSSSNRTVTAGSGQTGVIKVGGTSLTVNSGTMLTPAESVALGQVLGGGTQNLVLDASGRATGGQFTLSGNNLQSIVIPQGVTAVRNFAQSGNLTVTGNVSNAGNFFAVSNSAQTINAVISAQNIMNLQGGLLTSVLPAGGLSGFSNLLSSLHLTLNAVQNIVNYGTISSSGNLNLSAGNSIVNALPLGVSGPSPVMQAMQNVNIVTAALQNAGLVSALTGNLNIASQIAQNMTIDNTHGMMQAINGAINVRDQAFAGKFNTSLTGGDWISKQLNVFSGDGLIDVNVNSIGGQVNLIGGSASLVSASGDLHIGAMQMSGDPTISSAGDVLLEMSQFGGQWTFPGLQALTINAGGNIINKDVSLIGTSAANGATGSITMTAGGMIDLQTVPITSISTSTTNGNSGNITLTAGGPILLSGAISSHATSGNAGSVTINSTAGQVNTLGAFSIDSSATGGNAGAVSITASSGITAQNGMSINSSSDSKAAGAITISSQTGNIDLSGQNGLTVINASSGSGMAGQVNIQALNGNLNVGGGSFNLASTTGGGGGLSVFVNNGSVTFGNSTIDVSGKNGGSVSVLTTMGKADIDMSKASIKADGSSNGNSGSVTIEAGLNGASAVTSDKAYVGSIEVSGGNSSFSSIALSSSVGDVQVGSINSNGASISLTSAANVRVDSIMDNNASGQGGTVNVSSYSGAAASGFSNTLFVDASGGSNYLASINVDGAGGGSIFASNHGVGGITAGNIVINSASGNGGNIFLSADSAVTLGGANYSANAGTAGAGGTIVISGGTAVNAGTVNLSAIGASNFSGGTLSIFAPNITTGNLTADTSGHGTGSSGTITIGSNTSYISSPLMSLTNNGGGAGSVQITGSAQIASLSVIAQGGDFAGKNGGNISLVLTDGVHGNLNLDASGASGGSGGTITVTSNSNLDLTSNQVSILARGGNQAGNGGLLMLNSNGYMNVDSSKLDVSPQSQNGNGGSIAINTGLASNFASGALNIQGTLNADGAGNGNGGNVSITCLNTNTHASNLTIGNGSGFGISARSGLSSGNGGTVKVSVGGDLYVDGSAVSVATRGINGNGGSMNYTAGAVAAGQVGSIAHLLTINGSLSANSVGSGNAGTITMQAPQLNIVDGSQIAANASGSGKGGTVLASAVGTNSDISLGAGTSITATAAGAAGGSVSLTASRNISSTNSSTIDVSSQAAAGGQISLTAGNSQAGTISLDANLLANAGTAGNGGSISLTQNSASAMQIGQLQGPGVPGSGLLLAKSASGTGGTLTLSSGSNNDLNVALNQTIDLSGSSLDTLGSVKASSSGNVSVSGPGTLNGSFTGSGLSYNVAVAGAASNLGIKNVSSTNGNVSFVASSANSSLVFASGSTLTASKGTIEIGAAAMHFRGNSTITMDTAGVMKVDSGSQNGSLSMDFANGSTVTFNVTQGAAIRPGVIQVGPNGNGGLTLSSSGTANVDFTGGTVSMSSSNGAINLGSGLTLNSDSFDTTLNVGMEIVATNGDVNLSSAVSARQLNVATIATGNINLAADINSPTVVMSVQGSSTINQTGAGSIGIGTLVLNSQQGNIGSALAPIAANVLEMKVNSGASAYISNASAADVKTSTVAGTFQVNNTGDLAIENNVSAGSLNLSSSGNITMFNPVNGINSVTLAATGAGANIHIAAGGQLSSSSGSITLNTNNLILDGGILVQAAGAQVNINSSSALTVSGTSAQITASGGGNSLINISGSNSVSINSALTLNAGASGTAQIQTASLSSGGVNLGAGVALTAAGGTQLNVFSNQLSFGNGSSVSVSNATNGMTVQSTAGAPLTVSVSGTSTITSTAGGAVQFVAGTGSPLTFQTQGLGTASLNVNGGQLLTTSSAADTSINNINLNASNNIQVTVNGGKLNLNGNITSSQNGGVIVLQDPAGITINGNGIVGFASGLSGTILVQALSAGADLQIIGTPQFNAGSGSVSFSSVGSITFAANSSPTINGGATLNISAPVINFGAQSQVLAKGASTINISGGGSAGADIITASGSSSTISTNGGGAINVQGGVSGAALTFDQSVSGGAGTTLNFVGAPVNISTSNANVTISSNVVLHSDNNVTVQTPGGTLINNGQIVDPGTGTTTIIQAAGNLVIDKNVVANRLIIETTANNGNITLSANVNVVRDLTVSANGSGNITQTAGMLTAASITLMSQSGQIGSEKGRISVSTPELNVSTTGSAFVQSQGQVCVASFNVGGTFNLKSSGNIMVGAENAPKVNIGSNVVFDAGVNGTVAIAATNLISIANNVSVQVRHSALSLNAPNITIGNHSRITSDSNLSVSGNTSGTDFQLLSRGGNLQISGSLSGRNVSLATDSNGNIGLNGNVTAVNLSIEADGRGNITQSSGLISANNLELESDSGNIGSATSALNVSAAHLSAGTWGNGVVNINASGNLNLGESYSGRDFTVKSSGSMTVSEFVFARHGSITLQSAGNLQVEREALIFANEGNLTLQSTDAKNGKITIGREAALIALSSSASNPYGNVRVVVGNMPNNPVAGSKPGGVDLSQRWGGHAYFGNGITANGRDNSINAWGSNVIFSANSKSQIVLDGGVFILADPPPASAATSSSASVAPLSQPAVLPPQSFGAPLLTNSNFVLSSPVQTLPIYHHPDQANAPGQIIESTKSADDLQAVSYVSASVTAPLQGSIAKDVIERGQTATSTVYTSSCVYENKSSAIAFHKGEMLVNARRNTQVNSVHAILEIASGASAMIKSNGKGLEVFNVYEDHWGGVKVKIGGRDFVIGAGQRLVVGEGTHVAVRNEKTESVAEKSVKVAEFALMSLVTNSDLLYKLMHSEIKEDRQLGARLCKMAACLSVVTGAHGPFRN